MLIAYSLMLVPRSEVKVPVHVVSWAPATLPPGPPTWLQQQVPIWIQAVTSGRGPTAIPLTEQLGKITITVMDVETVTKLPPEHPAPVMLDESKKAVSIGHLLLVPVPAPVAINLKVCNYSDATSLVLLYRDAAGMALLRGPASGPSTSTAPVVGASKATRGSRKQGGPVKVAAAAAAGVAETGSGASGPAGVTGKRRSEGPPPSLPDFEFTGDDDVGGASAAVPGESSSSGAIRVLELPVAVPPPAGMRRQPGARKSRSRLPVPGAATVAPVTTTRSIRSSSSGVSLRAPALTDTGAGHGVC
jgi:hypothetical protein